MSDPIDERISEVLSEAFEVTFADNGRTFLVVGKSKDDRVILVGTTPREIDDSDYGYAYSDSISRFFSCCKEEEENLALFHTNPIRIERYESHDEIDGNRIGKLLLKYEDSKTWHSFVKPKMPANDANHPLKEFLT